MPEAEAPVLPVLSLGTRQRQTGCGAAGLRLWGDHPRQRRGHQHVASQDGRLLCGAAHGKHLCVGVCVCVCGGGGGEGGGGGVGWVVGGGVG